MGYKVDSFIVLWQMNRKVQVSADLRLLQGTYIAQSQHPFHPAVIYDAVIESAFAPMTLIPIAPRPIIPKVFPQEFTPTRPSLSTAVLDLSRHEITFHQIYRHGENQLLDGARSSLNSCKCNAIFCRSLYPRGRIRKRCANHLFNLNICGLLLWEPNIG